MILRSRATHSFTERLIYCFFTLLFFSGCSGVSQTPPTPVLSSPTTPTRTSLPSSTAVVSPTAVPSLSITPGPSPTSTSLPALEPYAWQANPIMIEGAKIAADPLEPFPYVPFFVLYGDGTLVIRACEQGECRYLQIALDQEPLCRIVNAVDRTGFLAADPQSVQVPPGTGALVRLVVDLHLENRVEIPDLDQWAESPGWYDRYAGCQNCYDPPVIDPAFIDLYRLLTTYTNDALIGMETTRLAVWVSEPVIAGTPSDWPAELPALTDLVDQSSCPGLAGQQQAVILEGAAAQAVASYLSRRSGAAPIFTDGEITLQVQGRWLIPNEMPRTCQAPAGLYPGTATPDSVWFCNPEMGAIPSPTATITPTPSVTPTPLR